MSQTCPHRGCRRGACRVRLWGAFLWQWLRTHWATLGAEEAYRIGVRRVLEAYRGE